MYKRVVGNYFVDLDIVGKYSNVDYFSVNLHPIYYPGDALFSLPLSCSVVAATLERNEDSFTLKYNVPGYGGDYYAYKEVTNLEDCPTNAIHIDGMRIEVATDEEHHKFIEGLKSLARGKIKVDEFSGLGFRIEGQIPLVKPCQEGLIFGNISMFGSSFRMTCPYERILKGMAKRVQKDV